MKGRGAMWERIVDFICLRSFRLNRIGKKLDRLGAEAAEEVLKLLLRMMKLAFQVWPDFRRSFKAVSPRL